MQAASAKSKIYRTLKLDLLPSWIRRWIVAIIGGVILLAGLAMLFLPGPAFIAIPVGLAILASEFRWARRWLQKAQDYYRKARKKWAARKSG